MADPSPVDRFLHAALPDNGQQQALVIGDVHVASSHLRFLETQMATLRDTHQVGTLGHEFMPFDDVFLWAYRDGNLPVSPEEAPTYLRLIFEPVASDPSFRKSLAATVDMLCTAIDHGIEVVGFDAREDVHDIIRGQRPLIDMIAVLEKSDPAYYHHLRVTPGALATLADRMLASSPALVALLKEKNIDYPFFKRAVPHAFSQGEALKLYEAHPQYRQWHENVCAVVDAARAHEIDDDAIAAALLRHAARPGKNVIAKIGLAHITGAVPDAELASNGTFHEHLASFGMPTTRAVMASGYESNACYSRFIGTRGPLFAALRDGGMPNYNLPPFLITDMDAVIDPATVEKPWFPMGLRHRLATTRDAYDALPPLTRVYDQDYIDRVKSQFEQPELSAALGKLARS